MSFLFPFAPKRRSIDLPARLISAAAGGRPDATAGPGGRVGRGCRRGRGGSPPGGAPGARTAGGRPGTPRWDRQPAPKREFLPPPPNAECPLAPKRARSFGRWESGEGRERGTGSSPSSASQEHFLKCLFMLRLSSTSSTILFRKRNILYCDLSSSYFVSNYSKIKRVIDNIPMTQPPCN